MGSVGWEFISGRFSGLSRRYRGFRFLDRPPLAALAPAARNDRRTHGQIRIVARAGVIPSRQSAVEDSALRINEGEAALST
jgi:hypothetical protein